VRPLNAEGLGNRPSEAEKKAVLASFGFPDAFFRLPDALKPSSRLALTTCSDVP
jgi:hypothetical protein